MLFSTHTTQPAAIIFDLGDVLIETKYLQCVFNIGPVKMASYALTFQNPFSCHVKLLDFLDKIVDHQEPIATKDHHGYRIPQLMCDWLKGACPPHEVLQKIEQHAHLFDNWFEKMLVQSVAQAIFVPENFAATRYLVPQGVEFVKACKAAGHQLYILSNWDPASFDLMLELYPEFFDLFEGILISGDIGLLKPNPEIFHEFLKRFDLEKDDCVFIDDLMENIIAAQKLGISSIHYKKKPGLFFESPDFITIHQKINILEKSKDFPIFIHDHWY